MSLIYPHEERARARSSILQLNDLAAKALESAHTGLILPSSVSQGITRITGTTDRSNQVDALNNLSERLRKHHLDRLQPLAHNEFNAFCEYVNPEEPPESRWHVWLTDKLQEIEFNPAFNRFILNCPPGHAKPLSVNTPVMMGNGSWKLLDDIVVGDHVLSHVGLSRAVTAVHDQGDLPLLKITTTCGRIIYSAGDHSFLSRGKFVEAANLRPGDPLEIVGHTSLELAAQRNVGREYTRDDFRLVALLGARLSQVNSGKGIRYQMQFTQPDNMYVAERLLTKMGIPFSKRVHELRSSIYFYLSAAKVRPFVTLAELDKPVAERGIPAWVFMGTSACIRAYLAEIVALRGLMLRTKAKAILTFHFRSERFTRDLQRLFARLGVDSTIDQRNKTWGLQIKPHGLLKLEDLEIGFMGEDSNAYKPYRASKLEPLTDSVAEIEPAGSGPCKCLTVQHDHTFLADGVVVHNSTYASRLFVAWRLGRNPNLRIIGGGHSQTFVENEFSKKIRNLVTGPEYKRIFPTLAIDHNTRAAAQWAIAGRTGQYAAKGVGQAVHGFRANFVIADDPYAKIEEAESATQRERVATWFIGDLGSRMLPGGKMFLIMTRFHEDDLTSTLMKLNDRLGPRSQWLQVEVPAICYDPENDILGRKAGEVLWDVYDLEYMKDKQAEFSFQRFSLIYQQNASATSSESIAGQFNYFKVPPHLENDALRKAKEAGQVDAQGRPRPNRREYFRKVILSVDTASKTSERADYTVIQTWGETHDRHYYLLRQQRVKVDFNAMIQAIEKQARKDDVDAILVEDKGQGTAYIQNRGKTNFQRRLAPAPIIPIDPKGQSKEFRFDEVTPMISEGAVYLPEQAPWIDIFIKEVSQFPQGAHDDQVDAMSQALRYFKTTRTRFGSRKIASFG